ncbi:MAG: ATP-binding protein [Nitrospiraceae bacterium]
MMNFYALSGLLNGLTATMLGILVYARDPRDPRHRTYGFHCLGIAIWSYFYCVWQMTESRDLALLSVRLLMAGAIFIPIFYLHHVLALLDMVERRRAVLNIGYALSGVFLVSDFTPWFIADLRPELSFTYWPKPGLIFHLFLLWFASYALYAIYLLGVAYRNTKGTRRNQYLYLIAASVIGYGGGSTNFFLWYGIQIPPDGLILVSVYTALVAYAIVKHRLMDITLVIHKGLAYSLFLSAIFVPIFVGVMVTERTTLYSIPPLLAGTLLFALGLWVVLKNPRVAANVTFGLVCSGACVWLFGVFLQYSSLDAQEALVWGKVSHAGVVLIPALAYHFSVSLIPSQGMNRVVPILYVVSAAFALLLPTDYLIDGQYRYAWAYYTKAGPLHPAFLTYFFFAGILTLRQLWLGYQRLKPTAKTEGTRIGFVFGAFAIGYLAAIDFAHNYGASYYPVGYVFVSLWALVATYGLLKYPLSQVQFLTKQRVLPYVKALAFTLAFYLVILLLIRAFTDTMQFLLAGMVVTTSLVLAEVLATLQKRMEKAVEKALFRNRYDAYETLTNFSKTLVENLDLRSLTEEIVHTLVKVIGIKTASLYLLDKEKNLYIQSSSYGALPNGTNSLRLRAGEGLTNHLSYYQSILVREEFEHQVNPTVTPSIIGALRMMEAEVCIPLVNKDRLLGFCNLGPRVGDHMYSGEDLNLLTMLAQNAAIALDNARLYEDLKRSQILMRRTDRLRSLETIAGGFAHEIRNPLTSIKTFVQLAPERKDDPEFVGHFSQVVSDDVARIERLIQEILDYARYMEPRFMEEDLNEVVASCLYFVEVKAASKSITMEKELAPDLPRVMLDRQQIKQVLLNLFLNAMDAIGDTGGRLTVRTQKLLKAAGGPWVQAEVTDTGIGISENNLQHIFDPFYTSKHESGEREGTGLGLTIVHQIVQEHRGYIEVESELGRGTSFFVNLPVNPRHSEVKIKQEAREETDPIGR